jgi:hypothetical protein
MVRTDKIDGNQRYIKNQRSWCAPRLPDAGQAALLPLVKPATGQLPLHFLLRVT